MGGESSKKSEVDLRMSHPKFQSAKQVTIGSEKTIKTVIGCNSELYTQWIELQDLKPYPQFLLLPLKSDFSTQGLCGSAGTLTINYEDYPYLLTDQIYNRKGSKKSFDECDLWYLMYVLASAKRDIQPFYSKIGDVRPHNVFINDRGEIKVSNRLSWPDSLTNWQKTLKGQVTYLAPEEVQQLQNRSQKDVQPDVSEIFSIGLTILSAATMTDMSYIYGPHGNNFDYAATTAKVHEFVADKGFSLIIKAAIANLCEFQPEARVTSQQLVSWVDKYQAKINTRRNFVVDQAPHKVHSKAESLKKALPMIVKSLEESKKMVGNSVLGGGAQSHAPEHQQQNFMRQVQIVQSQNTSFEPIGNSGRVPAQTSSVRPEAFQHELNRHTAPIQK